MNPQFRNGFKDAFVAEWRQQVVRPKRGPSWRLLGQLAMIMIGLPGMILLAILYL